MDIELQKLAKAAQAAFNTYKARLRREGHQVKNDMDYRNVSGISGTAVVLRDEWLEAESALERSAGAPSQVTLPEMGRETPNPLNLHYNHRYALLGEHGDIPAGTEFLFRGYNSADDLYSFYSDGHGGLRGTTTWVQESFDLVNAPAFDPNIPLDDPALGDQVEYEEDGGKYVVKRVSPERFAHLSEADSAKSLARKSPTAKSVEIMSDTSYVVTAVFPGASPEESKLWMTPCVPVDKDYKGEGVFKCGKDRWRLLGPETRIVVKIATVEAVVNQADPGGANQSNPMEWLKNFKERGFLGESDTVELAPRSFRALADQVGMVEPEAVEFYVSELEVHAKVAENGLEIEGWEEPTAEPALQVVEGGPESDAPDAEASTADAAEGSPAGVNVPTASLGEAIITDYEAAVAAVNKWNLTFTEAYDGAEVQVGIKYEHEEGRDLITLSWLDEPSQAPRAFLVDSQAVKDCKLSMVAVAAELVSAVKA